MTKVFLADDEIVIREGIRTSFPWSETDYQLVGEAPDGEIALSMIRDTKPDILITDIRMPFMDGLELCRIVRRQMPWIGIIILSGYDEFEYARQAIQLGVKEYMLKPITAQELRQVLETYIVEPKVFIAYHRMAFAADNDLRITLDTRIRSRMKNVNLVLDGTETPLVSAPEVLLEVKLAGPYPCWLSSILTSLHVYPDSFSKYGSIYISYVKNLYRNYVLENESALAGEASVCLRPF